MYTQIILAGFAIMLVSLSGKLMMWGVLGAFLQKHLKFLVTFALGTFMATLYLLFTEVRELSASLGQVALSAALGALILEVLQRIIPDAHHHHGADDEDCCDHTHGTENATINPKRILLGDALHNIGDGIVLVPAYFISFNVGLTLTIGILLHEFVQETSEFFLLRASGYSTKRALVSNFIVSGTIFIGIALSIFVSTATSYVPHLVALSVGALLYIIVRDLLPHTLGRIRHGGKPLVHIGIFFAGLVLMLAIAHILPG